MKFLLMILLQFLMLGCASKNPPDVKDSVTDYYRFEGALGSCSPAKMDYFVAGITATYTINGQDWWGNCIIQMKVIKPESSVLGKEMVCTIPKANLKENMLKILGFDQEVILKMCKGSFADHIKTYGVDFIIHP